MFNNLVLCLGLTLALGAAAAPLRMGGFVVAPIISGDDKAPLRGALRDYVERQVARPNGIELVWTEPTSLARAMESLKNGKIDILLLTSNPNNELSGARRFNWTYLRTRPQLAVLNDSPLRSVTSLQQLAGMQIGWIGGTTLPQGMEQAPINWQFLLTPNWQVLNLRKLQAGRIQAVFFENEYSPQLFARQAHLDIRLIPLPVPERNFTMAYSLKADAAQIIRFDKAAAAAFAGGQFQAYLEQYMKQ